MNKINKYLLTGIVSLSMTACANLDLNPLSEGSSENWYHDETEIEMALNDLWRPDFFPIDAIYWDDDLLNRMVLKDLMEGLEEEQREIILRRYFYNETQTQIAGELGISQVQVSRLEKRILKEMRKKL